MKGNQGTPFLKESAKPFHACATEIVMEETFKSEGATVVRTLQEDEVIEVLEGPRKEEFGEASRAKCKASKDGAVGWVTLKTRDGEAQAEWGDKYYQCTASIAITDSKDIKNCRVLRKLDVGEVFLALEGPAEEEGGVTRCKGYILKDQQEGWITIKGNAGTVYAELGSKHYKVLKQTCLQKKFKTDGNETVRMLEKGEVIAITDGPKDEKFEPIMRMKGRALSDSACGWITVKDKSLKNWSPIYKCLSATVVHDGFKVKESQVVRRMEVGELVEIVEGPTLETAIGVIRIKAKAEKDGALGWITVKGNGGTLFLKSIGK